MEIYNSKVSHRKKASDIFSANFNAGGGGGGGKGDGDDGDDGEFEEDLDMLLDNDEGDKSRPKKKQKTSGNAAGGSGGAGTATSSRRGGALTVLKHFRGVDPASVVVKSQLFAGLEFCVLPADEGRDRQQQASSSSPHLLLLSKGEIEAMVLAHGGKITQNVRRGVTTHIISQNATNIKLNNIIAAAGGTFSSLFHSSSSSSSSCSFLFLI
jgi:hypothetical protein